MGELYAGKSAQISGVQRSILDKFIDGVDVIVLDFETAKLAGELKCRFDMGSNDSFIAATALSEGLKLVTLNKRHFGMIPSLEIV